MGLLKKVRLTVKLQRVPNFQEIVDGEELANGGKSQQKLAR